MDVNIIAYRQLTSIVCVKFHQHGTESFTFHGGWCSKKARECLQQKKEPIDWKKKRCMCLTIHNNNNKILGSCLKRFAFFDLRFFHHHHRVPTTILFSIVAFANCVRLGKQRDHNDEISLLTSTNLVLPALMSTYFWQHRCHLLRLTKFFVGLRMLIVAKGFRVSHSYIYSIEQQPFFHQNPTKNINHSQPSDPTKNDRILVVIALL